MPNYQEGAVRYNPHRKSYELYGIGDEAGNLGWIPISQEQYQKQQTQGGYEVDYPLVRHPRVEPALPEGVMGGGAPTDVVQPPDMAQPPDITQPQDIGTEPTRQASPFAGLMEQATNPVDRFNLALLSMMQKAQGLYGQREAIRGAYYKRGFKPLPEELTKLGLSPEQLGAIRSGRMAALEPELEAANARIQEFDAFYEKAKEMGEDFARNIKPSQDVLDAYKMSFTRMGGKISDIPENVRPHLFKDMTDEDWNTWEQAMEEPEEIETKVLGKGLFERDPATGQWKMVAQAPEVGAGVGVGAGAEIESILPGASITPDQLSPIGRMVYDGIYKLSDITATQKAQIAPELQAVGWTNAVKLEDKQSISYIKNQMVDVMNAWKTVPSNLKGYFQGWIAETTKAGYYNEKVAAFSSAQGIVGMALTRLFEKGRISDQDRIFYMSKMPNLRMNEKSAQAGADELIRLLEEKLVSQIDELERKDGAISDLREQTLQKGYDYDQLVADGHSDEEIRKAIGL